MVEFQRFDNGVQVTDLRLDAELVRVALREPGAAGVVADHLKVGAEGIVPAPHLGIRQLELHVTPRQPGHMNDGYAVAERPESQRYSVRRPRESQPRFHGAYFT